MNPLRDHDEVSCVFCSRLHEMPDLTAQQIRDANIAHDEVLFYERERAKATQRVESLTGQIAKAVIHLEEVLRFRKEPASDIKDMWCQIASALSDTPSTMRPSTAEQEGRS